MGQEFSVCPPPAAIAQRRVVSSLLLYPTMARYQCFEQISTADNHARTAGRGQQISFADDAHATIVVDHLYRADFVVEQQTGDFADVGIGSAPLRPL